MSGLTLCHLHFAAESCAFANISSVWVPCTHGVLNTWSDIGDVRGRLHWVGGNAQVAAEKAEGIEGGSSDQGDMFVPFQVLRKGDTEVLEALYML